MEEASEHVSTPDRLANLAKKNKNIMQMRRNLYEAKFQQDSRTFSNNMEVDMSSKLNGTQSLQNHVPGPR